MVSRDFSDATGDALVVKGGARLRGEVVLAGARDLAVPLLAAALLSPGRSLVRFVPEVGEVATLERRLIALGCAVGWRGGNVSVDASPASPRAPDAHDGLWAAGTADGGLPILTAGALLGRFGEAHLPRDLRSEPEADEALSALEALGAEVGGDGTTVVARGGRLRGGSFAFARASVIATETALLAAVLAGGRSTLENGATAPEIEQLGQALNKMGARVHGAGTPLVSIEGVDRLHPLEHSLPGDWREAGTLLIAAALTRGNVLVRNPPVERLQPVIMKLKAAGVSVASDGDGVRVGAGELAPADIVSRPHPGFPAALLGPMAALMTRAVGRSVLTAGEDAGLTGDGAALACAPGLSALGADVTVDGRTLLVRGPTRLTGAVVEAPAVPGAAAAVLLAALAAEGTTEILRIGGLDRGYERLDRKLRALGASLRREQRTRKTS
jgi:UDP-N-acetylglucosamine 1-carboxyvinyltransferase